MSERVKELECVIADLTKQVQEARAENEKLRAALKPFSKKQPMSDPDEQIVWVRTTVKNWRAARAALKETSDETP